MLRNSPIKIVSSSFIILSTLYNYSFSQTFQRTFGSTGAGYETGTCIQNTLDGNYIISGIAYGFSNGYEDAYLIKMDPGGNVLWSKAYGGTYKDRTYYVNTCSDGGFILAGSIAVFSNGNYTDVYLVRTSSDGTLMWSRSVGGTNDDLGWYVTEANDGGFLCVGSTKSFNIGNYDGYVVKTNAAGTVQWTKVIGGSNTDNFHGMNKTNDGGYIITGLTASNSFGSSDVWLVKLNSVGDTLWTKQYGKVTEDAGNAVIQTSDGGYMIAGDIHINPAAGDHNECLLKTDASGNLQWVKTYGSSPGTEIAWDLRQTTDGGYLVLGSSAFYGNGGGGDILSIKTDNSGNVLWAKTYGSTAFDDFWYSQRTSDDGTLIVGKTSENGQKILVVRADSQGNSSCNTTSVVPNTNIPVLQTRSGTIVVSAGTSVIPNTLQYLAITASGDPCALVPVTESESANGDVFFYPNPFSGSSTLVINDSRLQNSELHIYNLLGNCIHKQSINAQYSAINLNISAGIYLFKVIDNQGVVKFGKFSIE